MITHANNGHSRANGMVVSDLHLFARRSNGFDLMRDLKTKLADMEVLVLNGDIFDFKWSTLRDQEATLAAATDWLWSLAEEHPRCRIHFVLGNHDCTPHFQRDLTKLAAAQPRFQWHEYTLRLGSKLFFHGECAHAPMDRRGLIRYRSVWQENRQRGPLLTTAYSCVDRMGITQFVHRRQFPRSQTVQRVAYYLDAAHPWWRAEVRDCYFGHTHLPFKDHEHEGVRFHNTGSAIRHLEFNPVFFECTAAEVVNGSA